MALNLPSGVGGLVPDLKTDFTAQLPFTVRYRSTGDGTTIKMWADGTPYKQIPPFKIPPAVGAMAPNAGGANRGAPTQPNQLFLYRTWPGEKQNEAHRFVVFNFPSATSGDVEVRYDAQQHCFRATAKNGVMAEGEPIIDEDVYRSPVQRGNL